MNISSVGSAVQLVASQAQGSEGVAVMAKVLDQQKTEGQDTEELIASAAQTASSGHALSVYA